MKMRGAKIFVETLKREGVKHIFGYPGGAVLPVFDELHDSNISFILTRHEQGAAHAADGYARSTGKVGVCIATSGPGATNLVTGIANAYMDSIPIVAFTGQVRTDLIGNDAFQEADVTGITRPITKHNFLVKNVNDLSRIVREAFYIASTGRPGPVVVDLPVDVQMNETDFNYPKNVDLKGYKPVYEGHLKQIERAAKLIATSKRPIIYAGGGIIISGASKELRELFLKTNIPVTTTLLGLGAFDQKEELSLDMLGMHGTVYANNAIMDSDLIIAIGARFDDRVTGKIDKFAPYAKVIHVDIDPAAISKNVVVDVPIVGDVKDVLKKLNKIVKKPKIDEWLRLVKQWKKEYPIVYDSKATVVKPQYVVEQIYKATGGDAIISTEVGQNQMWAAQFYEFTKPRTFISSGGLGTMGYGFPAAIGAQVGNPDKIVFDIAGDGSIQMNIQELCTVANYNIPVKIAILNNSYLGMIRQWQELFYKKRYMASYLKNPDFVKLAESFGVKGIRVEKKREVKTAINEAIRIKGPVLLDFVVSEEENVLPMVPTGSAINRMIGGMA